MIFTKPEGPKRAVSSKSANVTILARRNRNYDSKGSARLLLGTNALQRSEGGCNIYGGLMNPLPNLFKFTRLSPASIS